jgi:hypothetical protein
MGKWPISKAGFKGEKVLVFSRFKGLVLGGRPGG